SGDWSSDVCSSDLILHFVYDLPAASAAGRLLVHATVRIFAPRQDWLPCPRFPCCSRPKPDLRAREPEASKGGWVIQPVIVIEQRANSISAEFAVLQCSDWNPTSQITAFS